MSLISMIGSYIASTILIIMGWRLPEEDIVTRFHSRKRLILVFPHTSYWDFIMVVLYMLAVPEIRPYLFTVVNQRFFARFGPILHALNCIPATRREEKGKGFITTASEFLLKEPESRVLISPEGTIFHAEWRSGYYYLGKAIGADVVMAGVDFETKKLIMGPIREFGDKDFETITAELQKDMEQVVPLHSDQSYTKPREHNCADVGCADPLVVTTILFPLYPLYKLYLLHPLTAFSGLCCILMSFCYHYGREENVNLRNADFIFTFLGLTVTGVTYYATGILQWDLLFTLCFLTTIWCYYMAWGRIKTENRSWHYVVCHSMFHVMASITLSLPVYRAVC